MTSANDGHKKNCTLYVFSVVLNYYGRRTLKGTCILEFYFKNDSARGRSVCLTLLLLDNFDLCRYKL